MSHKIIIFGAGPMGGAIGLGLRKREISGLAIVDPNEERRRIYALQDIDVFAAVESVAKSDTIILAIPPQAFPTFVTANPNLQGHPGLLISVMAGIRIATIARSLAATQIVRSIPNTPSEVFQGMTVFCPSAATRQANIDEARFIFESIGSAICVADESFVDPATALCGGGPAFIAYLAEAMERYAVNAGFDDKSASLMTTQLLRGTADLIHATGKPARQICKDVMTPQGTTERGIRHFDECALSEIVETALGRSASRAKEIGEQLN